MPGLLIVSLEVDVCQFNIGHQPCTFIQTSVAHILQEWWWVRVVSCHFSSENSHHPWLFYEATAICQRLRKAQDHKVTPRRDRKIDWRGFVTLEFWTVFFIGLISNLSRTMPQKFTLQFVIFTILRNSDTVTSAMENWKWNVWTMFSSITKIMFNTFHELRLKAHASGFWNHPLNLMTPQILTIETKICAMLNHVCRKICEKAMWQCIFQISRRAQHQLSAMWHMWHVRKKSSYHRNPTKTKTRNSKPNNSTNKQTKNDHCTAA